jgi:hypothetical protein
MPKISCLTPEEIVFQAASRHVLVHQEQLPVLAAVTQQPHQVGVRQSAQKLDHGLHEDQMTPLVQISKPMN